MNLQILKRSEISPNAWDSFCLAWGGTLNHLTHFLDYYIVTNELAERSFGILFEGALLAVVPILLPHNNGFGDDSSAKESSILNQRPLVSSFGKQNELTNFLSTEMFLRIPVGAMYEFSFWKSTQVSATDYLERLFIEQGTNENLMVDLTSGEEHLFKNLSRGHQRTIKKSISSGQSTIILDNSSSPREIEEGFSLYRVAHAMAAGRITRSNESFELMLKYIHSGVAALFIGRNGERNLSFLYCDFAGGFSRGWSQANSQRLNFGEFPRHQTEWEAMKYFSKRGVHYYHLGVIDVNTVGSSTKSDSINEYKLRFHPIRIKGAIKSFRKGNPDD